jgi:hypothetical protein
LAGSCNRIPRDWGSGSDSGNDLCAGASAGENSCLPCLAAVSQVLLLIRTWRGSGAAGEGPPPFSVVNATFVRDATLIAPQRAALTRRGRAAWGRMRNECKKICLHHNGASGGGPKTATRRLQIEALDQCRLPLPMRDIFGQKSVRVVLRRPDRLSGWKRSDAGR